MNAGAVTSGMVERYAGSKTPPAKPRPDVIAKIAHALDVPVEWFYADLSRIGDLVPDGAEIVRLDTRDEPGRAVMLADARRTRKALEPGAQASPQRDAELAPRSTRRA